MMLDYVSGNLTLIKCLMMLEDVGQFWRVLEEV